MKKLIEKRVTECEFFKKNLFLTFLHLYISLKYYDKKKHHFCPNGESKLFFVDINECVRDQISDEYQHLEHNCHVDANCTNTKGSFYCNCLKGFSGDGVTCVGRSDLDVAK